MRYYLRIVEGKKESFIEYANKKELLSELGTTENETMTPQEIFKDMRKNPRDLWIKTRNEMTEEELSEVI